MEFAFQGLGPACGTGMGKVVDFNGHLGQSEGKPDLELSGPVVAQS